MSEPGPVGVVIPAYNEGAVIQRLLDGLAPGLADGSLEVVVVPNGCTDDTAEVARAAGFPVIELDQGDKIAALNAGDAALSSYPRFYVDADVVLDAGGLLRLADAFDASTLAVSPAVGHDMTGTSFLARSYLRIWYRLEWAADSLTGRGCYGVSRAGRERWDQFSDAGDDAFINSLFTRDERRVVPAVTSVVRGPRTLWSAIQIKRRIHKGNREVEERGVAVTSSTGWIDVVRREPRRLLDAPVYVIATVVARLLAAGDRRRGATEWHRDSTSRT